MTPEVSSKIINRSKVRRERQNNRFALRLQELWEIKTHGLYFDGPKDKTLAQVKKGNNFYRQTVVDEHIVLEPECIYIGHVSPYSGTSQSIKDTSIETKDLEPL